MARRRMHKPQIFLYDPGLRGRVAAGSPFKNIAVTLRNWQCDPLSYSA